jgi:hypothetical protein
MRPNLPAAPPAGPPGNAPALHRALRMLLDVSQPARPGGHPPWDSALPWPCLSAAGLTEGQMRELLAAGHLEHGRETTAGRDRRRSFRRSPAAALSPRSCLVLTERGAAHARELLAARGDRPRWDAAAGELWWHGRLVKRFRHDAANQRLVLDALETAGWPPCLANPFRARGVPRPKTCLHRTVESLNKGQGGRRRIYFGGDGRGGLCWGDKQLVKKSYKKA